MKTKLILFFTLIIGASLTFNCSKSDLTDELDGPIPDDYPQLEEEGVGIVTMILNNGEDLIDKKLTYKLPGGVAWDASIKRYTLTIDNPMGTKSADLWMSDIKKGTYTQENPRNNMFFLINHVYYVYYSKDETSYFNITIAGNNGKEIWGDFDAKLRYEDVSLFVTEGKFSAKIYSIEE